MFGLGLSGGLSLAPRSAGLSVGSASVSTIGVTYAADGGVTASGTFLGGEAWMVAPAGTTLNARALAAETGAYLGGAQHNPKVNSQKGQGYDPRDPRGALPESPTYDPNLRIEPTAPVPVVPGDVVTQSVLSQTLGTGNTNKESGILRVACCYILSEAPPANAFAPPAVLSSLTAPADRPAPEVVDLDALLASITTYPTTIAGGASSDMNTTVPFPAPLDNVLTNVETHAPQFAQSWTLALGYELIMSRYMTSIDNADPPNDLYGGSIGAMFNVAALHMLASETPPDKRRRLLVALIRHGIQMNDPWLIEPDEPLPPLVAGHNQFALVPTAISLWARGRSDEVKTLPHRINDVNLLQPFRADPRLIAEDKAPHDSYARPYIWRRRKIVKVGGVSGTMPERLNIVTWRAGDFGDGTKGGFETWFRIVRESDGASAVVVNEGNESSDAQGSTASDISAEQNATNFYVDINPADQPTPAFSVDDVVYFEPIEDHPQIGEYQWNDRDFRQVANIYSPKPTDGYIEQYPGGDDLMILAALGLFNRRWNEYFDATAGYSIMANEVNTPSATWDYANAHGNYYTATINTMGFPGEFWNEHWNSIKGSIGVVSPTALFLKITAITTTGATLEATTTGALTIKAVVVPADEAKPSEAQIKAGQRADGTAAIWASTAALNAAAAGTTSEAITGLTGGAEYAVYAVGTDAALDDTIIVSKSFFAGAPSYDENILHYTLAQMDGGWAPHLKNGVMRFPADTTSNSSMIIDEPITGGVPYNLSIKVVAVNEDHVNAGARMRFALYTYDADGVTLDNGLRIPTSTVAPPKVTGIWNIGQFTPHPDAVRFKFIIYTLVSKLDITLDDMLIAPV